MMTFSLRPRRWSTLPLIAASVRTRVVSWKLAAEMNESVRERGLGDAEQQRVAARRLLAVRRQAVVLGHELKRSTTSSIRNSLSPTSSTFTQRIIWREITSMCLSLMLTPWRR